ncbi:Acetylcholine receptor subunit beta-like 2 [Nymphon striatum]|nr:Acetylcholine receptor subunit beta-like 2 [Nymphon striatum]
MGYFGTKNPGGVVAQLQVQFSTFQSWDDYTLRWDPSEYGGLQQIYIPSEQLWLPDLVIYNNADGHFDVSIMTKAMVTFNGKIHWGPPAIYKSSCQIDVRYFPFDMQTCTMKFGMWSYDGNFIDLRHLNEIPGNSIVDIGMDLTEFYLSAEWDIINVPAIRNVKWYYDVSPYPFLVFNITVRRKTLYYTINFITPCVGISALSVLVFYLPSDSGEKISLCITIELSLVMFLLLLSEITPSTSLAVPLLGKFLMFTMILVTLSIIASICILNFHYRPPSNIKMSLWVKRIFIQLLPRFLLMSRPEYDPMKKKDHRPSMRRPRQVSDGDSPPFITPNRSTSGIGSLGTSDRRNEFDEYRHIATMSARPERWFSGRFSGLVKTIMNNIFFIANHIEVKSKNDAIKEDWKYVALILDRLCLLVFTTACVVGSMGIILQAPSLYDSTVPIDSKLSRIVRGRGMDLFKDRS